MSHNRAAVHDYLGGEIDLTLIDGWHSNEQQTIDLRACKASASADCTYLLHDIINWNMGQSFFELREEMAATHAGEILTRTASGMGLFYPRSAEARIGDTVRAFIDPLEVWPPPT